MSKSPPYGSQMTLQAVGARPGPLPCTGAERLSHATVDPRAICTPRLI